MYMVQNNMELHVYNQKSATCTCVLSNTYSKYNGGAQCHCVQGYVPMWLLVAAEFVCIQVTECHVGKQTQY